MADVGPDQFSTPELRVRLIGRFEVAAGQPLRLPVGKATTVLQLLVVRRRSFVSVDTLADVLWDDDPPVGAAQNIASLVSRLRRVLGADRIVGGRSGYRFETAGCWVDIDEAERLVKEADGQLRGGRPALAAAAAAQARRLLERGDFLEDEPYATWAVEGRRQAERLTRRARRVAWTAALVLHDHRLALDVAEGAIDADPLDEEAHRAAMQALYLGGDAAAALAAYERARETLVEALGADPSGETEALYLAILRAEPVSPAGRPAEVPVGAAPPTRAGELVGRDAEIAALYDRWTAAAGGHPGLIVVSGAAGAGKTRVTAVVAERAGEAGAAVLRAGCHEAERSLFLQPILEALRGFVDTLTPGRLSELAGPWTGTLAELMPELRSLVAVGSYERATPELEHRRSLEAVAGFLQRLSREQPTLLLLDDLHHGGESTLEALHFILERLTNEPLLVMATVVSDREDDVIPLLGPRVAQLALGPLTLAGVEELARRFRAAGTSAVELHERTGGHPQFVVEALRLAAGGDGAVAPESLRHVVEQRVARAGREVEELLRAAAVVGTSFDLDFVAALADIGIGDAARRAEHALRAGLLETDGAHFRFAGSVIRDVLYETTPAPIRTSLHRRAAARLGDRPEAAAIHHGAVGDWGRAHAAWSAAAEHAIRAFALRDGERLLSEAVASAEREGDARAAAHARIRRGQLREELAEYSAAQDDHTAALDTARRRGDEALEAQALERLGWTAYYGRDSAAAAELAGQATELAESAAAAPAALPSALVLVGRIRHWAGDIDGAAEAYEAALARDPDPPTTASALSCLGALLEHGDRFLDARRTLDRAAAESTRTGAFRPLLRTLFFAGLARANLGDFGGALRALERKRRLLDEYDVHFYRARTDTSLSWVWREVGELGRAQELADQAVVEAREVKAGSLQVEQELHGLLGAAECALLAGDEGGASELVAEAEPLLSAWLPFKWRADLRYREVRCRLVPGEAEELLELSRRRRSRKYEALALAHLGRHEEAAVAAADTGSGLLVAEVAPASQARAAFDGLTAAMPSELREGFATRGRLARLFVARGYAVGS
ncbi:MAG TPA: AAA family ATPase [Acidimicrobiales bacterium]|nr:AAA family ATPase [Acidimicrobiales bacterium]